MIKSTFLFISVFVFILCMCSCNPASDEEYIITIDNDIESSELDSLDIEKTAIAPMYLPQQMNDNSINCEYQKSGLDALINVDDQTIVKFAFVKVQDDETSNFPSVGEAKVIACKNHTKIYYRLSNENGCIVTSENVTADELEKILNSFTVRDTI